MYLILWKSSGLNWWGQTSPKPHCSLHYAPGLLQTLFLDLDIFAWTVCNNSLWHSHYSNELKDLAGNLTWLDEGMGLLRASSGGNWRSRFGPIILECAGGFVLVLCPDAEARDGDQRAWAVKDFHFGCSLANELPSRWSHERYLWWR